MDRMAYTPSDLCSVSSAYWANYNRLKLQSGVFSFTDRPYLFEPMESRSQWVCAMKATGGGFSECLGILPSIHGMIFGRYPQGVLYMFPTNDDVQDFSKSRFATLIDNNGDSIGRWVKSGGAGTDTAQLKKIGTAFLYLRGGRLNPSDEGSGAKRSTKLSGIQVDRIVPDEVDQMDSEAIAKARGRMGNARVDGVKGRCEERYIANPSDVDRGIDLYWQVSDQREWFVKCVCGGKTCALRNFLNDPEKTVGYYNEKVKRPDGVPHRGFVRCSWCGRPIGNSPGEWIAGYPSVKDKIGYQWNHLASLFNDPARILEDFRNPPEGNIGDVYRLDLGMPYSSSTDRLAKDVVLRCCGPDVMADTHRGPCAMGVDIGTVNHVVIGVRTGRDRYEIIKVAQVSELRDAHELANRYNVKSAVVDIGPYGEAQRVFQRSEHYKVYLCEYTDSPLQEAVFNDNNGVVKAFRTGIFDKTHRLLTDGEIRLPRIGDDIREFARQCCNCVKSKKEDKRKQQIVFRYEATGAKKEDHYRNALNYFVLAASGFRIAQVGSRHNQSKKTLNEYAKI